MHVVCVYVCVCCSLALFSAIEHVLTWKSAIEIKSLLLLLLLMLLLSSSAGLFSSTGYIGSCWQVPGPCRHAGAEKERAAAQELERTGVRAHASQDYQGHERPGLDFGRPTPAGAVWPVPGACQQEGEAVLNGSVV